MWLHVCSLLTDKTDGQMTAILLSVLDFAWAWLAFWGGENHQDISSYPLWLE